MQPLLSSVRPNYSHAAPDAELQRPQRSLQHYYFQFAIGYFDGALMLTSTCLLPPNNRPPKTKSAATTIITKITSTATTPALPPPPLSPITFSPYVVVCRTRRQLFPRPVASGPLRLHSLNQSPKRNKQKPAQSLPVEPDASWVCQRQRRPRLSPVYRKVVYEHV